MKGKFFFGMRTNNTIQPGGYRTASPSIAHHTSASRSLLIITGYVTHIGVLISGPGSCYPEYFLTAVSLSHFPGSGSGVSESLRATEDHKRAKCTVACTVLYCAPLYRQQQGRAEQSLQCCHRWTNVDNRHQVIVCRKIYFVSICKADI